MGWVGSLDLQKLCYQIGVGHCNLERGQALAHTCCRYARDGVVPYAITGGYTVLKSHSGRGFRYSNTTEKFLSKYRTFRPIKS